jgi:putative spermidine/putrescine transport system permease protein
MVPSGIAGTRHRVGAWGLAALVFPIYLFLIAPLIVVVPMSFGNEFEFQFPPTSFSLFLYQKLLSDYSWMKSLGISFNVAALSTALALTIGVPASYGLVRGEYPGKQLITLFLLSPIFIPVVVIAFALYLYFTWLRLVGTLAGLVLAHSMYVLPFVLITCISGLRHVDRNLEAMAAVMGASRLTIFRRVTLPLLRPALVVGALFAFLMSFDEVVISLFIVNTNTITLPVKMYTSVQQDSSPILAAVSSLLAVLSIIVCLVGAWLQRAQQS